MRMTKQKNSKKEISIITILFLMSRLLLILFIIKKGLSATYIHDAIHYINIAKNGYTKELLYAFFPLFPLLIRLLHYIIPSYEISALILSNLFSFITTFILYNIIEEKKYKLPAVIVFLFSPILVFNSIGYTESLYLLLTITAFYFYKKKNYLLTGIFIGLSIITRNTGIVLLGAIGLDMLYNIYKKENSIKDLILLSIIPIGITILYHTYLYIHTNDFFKYITVQYTEWNRERSNLITIIIKDIKYITNNNYISLYIFLQNWIFYFLGFIYALRYIKKEKALSIYMIVSLLLFVTTCRTSAWKTFPSISLFRYVFSLFPIYILPFINKRPKHTITNITILIILFILSILNYVLAYQLIPFIA